MEFNVAEDGITSGPLHRKIEVLYTLILKPFHFNTKQVTNSIVKNKAKYMNMG